MNKGFLDLLQRARLITPAACTLALFLSSCDNVQWGGISVSVHKPTAERAGAEESFAEDTLPEAPVITLPEGPVLFHVTRLDPSGRAIIEPVAELSAGGLRSVSPEQSTTGSEYASLFNSRFYGRDQIYTLFRGAARVGTLVIDSPIEGIAEACPRLRAEGWLELAPPANALAEFLAWPPGVRAGGDSLIGRPAYRSEMQNMAAVLAGRGVRDIGISGAWRLGAPDDLQPLRVGTGARGFAATFVVRDSLGEGPPADSAGMAFVVADYDPARGYFPLYFDAVWYGPGGKRTLRWVDAVSLTGDPDPEWLIRAHGDAVSWYEVVSGRDTTWSVTWSSRNPACEALELSGQ